MLMSHNGGGKESEMDRVFRNPDIFRLKVPLEHLAFEFVNCYFVVDGGDYLVVDPGMRLAGNAPLIDEAIVQLELDPARMRIFLTHLHLDHSGMVDLLARPETPVFAPRGDLHYRLRPDASARFDATAENMRLEGVPEEEVAESMRLFAWNMSLPDPAGCDLRPVDAGDVLQVGRYRFDLVGLPGHSPGQLGAFNRATGVFLSGDHVLYGISPAIDYLLSDGNGMDVYVESLRRTQRMPIELLLPGHGEAEGGHFERMRQIIGHKLARAQAVYERIAACPGATGYDAIKSIRWSAIPGRWEDAALDTRGYIVNDGCIAIDHLVRSGQVVRTTGPDGVRRYKALEG